uniref:Endonuclease/exonuclease/phosphatase domain-containing protein n=1 Tax=Spongospora subterranea TaxID=70186 RepID=A0A0H5QFG9_9EUKA|eukprot:CRZ00705.1 hypothetical protein [Spongospora subterranea]
MNRRFRLFTHNILAEVWCTPSFYPNIRDRSELLSGELRRARIHSTIQSSDADIVCLQEVQANELCHLRSMFANLYHISELSGNCPTTAPIDHGTIMMVKRSAMLSDVHVSNHVWSGEGSAGQIMTCQGADSTDDHLIIAHVHLSWKGYGRVGRQQAQAVTDLVETRRRRTSRIIWCGDFNATPDRLPNLIPQMSTLHDAYRSCPTATWISPKHKSFRLDYVLHSAGLNVNQLHFTNDIPGPDLFRRVIHKYGSDHVPLMTDFEFSK